jgi:hypothetical protein
LERINIQNGGNLKKLLQKLGYVGSRLNFGSGIGESK